MPVAPSRELQRCAQFLREGRFAECKPLVLQLAARFPTDVPVMKLAVQCLGSLGEHHAALYHAKRLLATGPRDGGLLLNVARLHARASQHDDALAAYDASIAAGTLDAIAEAAQHRLALGRFSEGLRAIERDEHLLIRPSVAPQARHALAARIALIRAQLHFAQGDVRACMLTCEGVQFAEPQVAASLQAVKASCLNYLDDVPPERVFAEHRKHGELLEQCTLVTPQSWTARLGTSAAPLRIGILSPDMRTHSVAVFALPLLRQLHARARDFHVSVFHVGGVEDATTAALKRHAHAWHHLPYRSAEQIASDVRAAGIDIAIEMAGLTDTLALTVLAHGVAPLSMSAVGYPNTTGTTRVATRLVDSASDPAPAADAFATERLVRLDPCFLCYVPPEDAPPARCDQRDAVTFASFNAVQKISPFTARLWRDVLHAVPGSTLLLKSSGLHEATAMDAVRTRLGAWGLPMERVTIMPSTPSRKEHLAMYASVDIALDPFPYHGTTTTCEALWMGVPVISLAGQSHVSRVGVSLLGAAGLPQLLATSPAEYVRLAAELARDAATRHGMRQSLRDVLRSSVLCDEHAYGERLARTLQSLWIERCTQG